jgi:deoxyadenosine/deoxycytidine kinase
MNERLKYQGRLVEKRIEAKNLKLRIQGMIYSIRAHLDPFDKIENIPALLVARQAVDLSEYHTMYTTALDEIEKLKEEIGI